MYWIKRHILLTFAAKYSTVDVKELATAGGKPCSISKKTTKSEFL